MLNYEPIEVLPLEFQEGWRAEVTPATPTAEGVFRLVGIRRTQPKSFEEGRIVVLVLDENGTPLPGVRVAFAYSTAPFYTLPPETRWRPPAPQRAFIVPTQGSGQIDQIQGSAVKPNEPGGVTVYIFEPNYASDAVSGCGMLGDHTGLHLTFQLRRSGVQPLAERLTGIEARLAALEGKLGSGGVESFRVESLGVG